MTPVTGPWDEPCVEPAQVTTQWIALFAREGTDDRTCKVASHMHARIHCPLRSCRLQRQRTSQTEEIPPAKLYPGGELWTEQAFGLALRAAAIRPEPQRLGTFAYWGICVLSRPGPNGSTGETDTGNLHSIARHIPQTKTRATVLANPGLGTIVSERGGTSLGRRSSHCLPTVDARGAPSLSMLVSWSSPRQTDVFSQVHTYSEWRWHAGAGPRFACSPNWRELPMRFGRGLRGLRALFKGHSLSGWARNAGLLDPWPERGVIVLPMKLGPCVSAGVTDTSELHIIARHTHLDDSQANKKQHGAHGGLVFGLQGSAGGLQ